MSNILIRILAKRDDCKVLGDFHRIAAFQIYLGCILFCSFNLNIKLVARFGKNSKRISNGLDCIYFPTCASSFVSRKPNVKTIWKERFRKENQTWDFNQVRLTSDSVTSSLAFPMFCPAAPLEGAPAKTSVTFGQEQSQETPDDVVRQVAEIAVFYLQTVSNAFKVIAGLLHRAL